MICWHKWKQVRVQKRCLVSIFGAVGYLSTSPTGKDRCMKCGKERDESDAMAWAGVSAAGFVSMVAAGIACDVLAVYPLLGGVTLSLALLGLFGSLLAACALSAAS